MNETIIKLHPWTWISDQRRQRANERKRERASEREKSNISSDQADWIKQSQPRLYWVREMSDSMYKKIYAIWDTTTIHQLVIRSTLLCLATTIAMQLHEVVSDLKNYFPHFHRKLIKTVENLMRLKVSLLLLSSESIICSSLNLVHLFASKVNSQLWHVAVPDIRPSHRNDRVLSLL